MWVLGVAIWVQLNSPGLRWTEAVTPLASAAASRHEAYLGRTDCCLLRNLDIAHLLPSRDLLVHTSKSVFVDSAAAAPTHLPFLLPTTFAFPMTSSSMQRRHGKISQRLSSG